MPSGDRTGPTGMGSITGRAMGFCAGYGTPGFLNNQSGRFSCKGPGGGRSFVDNYGRGRGFRHMFYATGVPGWRRGGYGSYYVSPQTGGEISKEDEIRFLKDQAEYFKKAAEDINARLKELDNKEVC